MKHYLSSTALSAFLLSGVAFAQTQDQQNDQDADQVEDVSEYVEQDAEEPITTGDLKEDKLDKADSAEELNQAVLEATTKKDAANIARDENGQRQQVAADSSTTPDRPNASQMEMTEKQQRQAAALAVLLDQETGQTDIAQAADAVERETEETYAEARNATRNAAQSAEQTAENAEQEVEETYAEASQATSNAAENAEQEAEETYAEARNATRNAAQNTEQAAENAEQEVEETYAEASQATRNAAENAEQEAEETYAEARNATRDAAQETEQAAENAEQEVEETYAEASDATRDAAQETEEAAEDSYAEAQETVREAGGELNSEVQPDSRTRTAFTRTDPDLNRAAVTTDTDDMDSEYEQDSMTTAQTSDSDTRSTDMIGDSNQSQDTRMAGDRSMDNMSGDRTMEMGNGAPQTDVFVYLETVRLLPEAVNARRLIGSDILGPDDEQVAEIRDMIVDGDGVVTDAILESGGFFGLGERTYSIAFSELAIVPDGSGDLQVNTVLDEDAVQNLERWEEDDFAIGENGMTLVSELRSANIRLGQTDETVSVEDVVLSEMGAIRGIVVSYNGEEYVTDYDRISVSEGDADGDIGYTLNLTPENIVMLPVLVVDPANMGNASAKGNDERTRNMRNDRNSEQQNQNQ